jgi:hypothetical protein
MEVIQCINQADDISTMSHLIRIYVMLELRSVDVIIGRIPVDESVEEERVEGESPVSG